MSSFSGVVALEDDPGSAVAATVEVDAGMLVLKAGGSEIGAWNLDEIKVEQSAGGFSLRADGENLILTTPDVSGFADAVGLSQPKREKSEKHGKRKRFGFRSKADQPPVAEPAPEAVAAPPPPTADPAPYLEPEPMAPSPEAATPVEVSPDLPAFLREEETQFEDEAPSSSPSPGFAGDDPFPTAAPDPEPLADSIAEPIAAWEPAVAPLEAETPPFEGETPSPDLAPALPPIEELRAAAALDSPGFSPPQAPEAPDPEPAFEPAPPAISFGAPSAPAEEPSAAAHVATPAAPVDPLPNAELDSPAPVPMSEPAFELGAPEPATEAIEPDPTPETIPETAFGLGAPEAPSTLSADDFLANPRPEARVGAWPEPTRDAAPTAPESAPEPPADPWAGVVADTAGPESDVSDPSLADPWRDVAEPSPSIPPLGDQSREAASAGEGAAGIAAIVDDDADRFELPIDTSIQADPFPNGVPVVASDISPAASPPAIDPPEVLEPADVAGRDVPDIAGVAAATIPSRYVTVHSDEPPAAEDPMSDHGADMATAQELTDWAEDANGTAESDDVEIGGVVPSRFATLRSRSAENYSDEEVLSTPMTLAMFGTAFGLALGALLTWGIYALSDSFPVERLISAVAAFAVAGGAYLGWRRERRIGGAILVIGGGILALAAVFAYAREAEVGIGYLLATAGAVSAVILGIVGVTRFGHGPDPRIHD